MTIRLFTSAVVLLGIFAAARWAGRGGIPTEPAPLQMKAQDLPLAFGEWKGENVAVDKDIFNAIGAHSVVDRQYRDRSGRLIVLHFAVFDKFAGVHEGLMHPPDVCYNGSGWTLGEPKDIPLGEEPGAENAANLLPVERQGQTAYVLHWFQIDGVPYHTYARQRSLLTATRGRPLRPPIVKVMLQTSAASPAEAEKTLTSFAAEVYKWTRDFH
jgi:EpsI family protein